MKFIVPDDVTLYSVSLLDMEMACENVLNGAEESVFVVEHEGVYSAGKSFEPSDFIGFCEYPIYYTKRGGRVTVHNVGQVVVYPILDLKKRNLNVSHYVSMLERWMIAVLDKFKIRADLSDEGIGVWLEGSKIGFIGIRVEKGVSMHGLCLNVNNDLYPFEKIIPCGINNVSITSIQNIFGHKIDIQKVKNAFVETFNTVFDK